MGVPAGRQLDGAAGREAGTDERVESGLTTFLTLWGQLCGPIGLQACIDHGAIIAIPGSDAKHLGWVCTVRERRPYLVCLRAQLDARMSRGGVLLSLAHAIARNRPDSAPTLPRLINAFQHLASMERPWTICLKTVFSPARMGNKAPTTTASVPGSSSLCTPKVARLSPSKVSRQCSGTHFIRWLFPSGAPPRILHSPSPWHIVSVVT
jgi:hypothetical protein